MKQIKEKEVHGVQGTADSSSGEKTLTSVMKSPQESDDMTLVYKMDHELRGKAVIFNNVDFALDMGLRRRFSRDCLTDIWKDKRYRIRDRVRKRKEI